MRPSSGKFSVLLASLMLAAAMLAPSGASGADSGLNVNFNLAISSPQVAQVKALGPRWARIFEGWATIEPTRGGYDQGALSVLDRAIANLPPGTKVDVALFDTPAWASGNSRAHGAAVPTSPQDFADMAGFMAKRYRGVVTAWEIWNEPDGSTFWAGDVAQYTTLLRAAYPAVKAGDPNALVISGGLVGNDYDYLEQIYANGGQGSFDAVGLHTDTACNVTSPDSYLRNPDGRINRYSFLGYREVHNTMVTHGDGAKPIYMTEFGWNTSTITCPTGLFAGQKAAGVNPDTQAHYLALAYHCLAGDPYMAAAMWFDFADLGAPNTPEDRFGLLSTSLAPKPAFNAFADYAQNGDRLTGGCGNFTGPQIAIVSPKPGAVYKGILPIHVRATSPYGVGRITLLHDGQKIRNFGGHPAPTTLNGTMNWFGAKHISFGKHVITVLAKDPQGNITSVNVTVVHSH